MIRSGTARAQAVGRELASMLRAAANLPAALGRRAPHLVDVAVSAGAPAPATATPVILVHGYLGTQDVWTPLVRRLHGAGYVNVSTLRYDALSAGVPELGAALVDVVTAVVARTGRQHVHLVGHSLGGLVVRYAVQRLGLDRVTASVATVAAPHRGIPLAWFGPGPAAAQLRSGSALFRGLPPLDGAGPVRWAVIHGSADLIVPAPPAGAGTRLAGYGHHSILTSPELADAILDHLVAAEPASVRLSTATMSAPLATAGCE
jgi:pimeloyl-ACP methyl ester carboxylesterase